MLYSKISVNIKENIAFITINRAQKGNALSDAIIKELTHFFSIEPSKIGARVAVLRGEGTRYFCSGADLNELTNKNTAEQIQGFSELAILFETIRKSQVISLIITDLGE